MNQIVEFATQTLVSIGSGVGASAFIVWATKSIISERLKNAIKSEYDQKLETHKAALKAQADVEIEKLKSQLSIAAAERNILFTRLHEMRADVVSESYALLKKLYVALVRYTAVFEPVGMPPKEERRKVLAATFNEFDEYITTRMIFLPKSTAKTIESIRQQIIGTYNRFFFVVEMPGNPNKVDEWVKIADSISGEISSALDELEDDFRTILGDNGPHQSVADDDK